MQGKGEKKQIIVAIMHVCVCAHVLYKLSVRGKKQESVCKDGMKPQATSNFHSMHSFWGYEPHYVTLKSVVPHANPLLWSTCFHQSIMFSSTKLLAAQGGPPLLGSGFCQRSVFCSYFRGKALHLVLGREGIFPLNCFFSLSRALFKVNPLEIFSFQDLFLHKAHTLFYVLQLSFLLTKHYLRALLILAEGEECCLL